MNQLRKISNRKFKDLYSQKIKSTRYLRKRRQKRKEAKLIEQCRSYINGYGWSDYDFIGYGIISKPAENAYVKRYYRGKRSDYLKKVCNRKFRKNKTEYRNKSNIYRKVNEFWWELY